MPNIRHHLRIAQGLLTCARANLETAFTLTIDAHYDPKCTCAIDDRIAELARSVVAVNNITTMIQQPNSAFE